MGDGGSRNEGSARQGKKEGTVGGSMEVQGRRRRRGEERSRGSLHCEMSIAKAMAKKSFVQVLFWLWRWRSRALCGFLAMAIQSFLVTEMKKDEDRKSVV